MYKFVIGLMALALSGVAGWLVLPRDGLAFLLNDQTPIADTLDTIGWQHGSPVYVRIFKAESELEIFGLHDGRWTLLKTFPICTWSGTLGPKYREGDLQSPEGFYEVDYGQLNPNSTFHLSFNLGFPNAVERAQGRTGSFLMVHGNCVSIGCYAMTDGGIEEIYGLVEAALTAGQSSVPVHAFPFRMTETALRSRQDHPEHEFWMSLKPAYDLFEETGEPPAVFACGAAYQIGPARTPLPNNCKLLRSS